jgi:hypothetical protein
MRAPHHGAVQNRKKNHLAVQEEKISEVTFQSLKCSRHCKAYLRTPATQTDVFFAKMTAAALVQVPHNIPEYI